MITINDNTYRNLQERVLKNELAIKDILETAELLSDFGLQVVGSVETVEQLPDPATYTGVYGDAYTVGTEPPYDFYIYTRPNEATGETAARWFDIGQFPKPGPTGPEGPRGPVGSKGEATVWYYTASQPYDSLGVNGDFSFTADGNIYQKVNNAWVLRTRVVGSRGPQGERGLQGERGPQGFQGERGPTGPKGAASVIYGKVSSVNQLPTPTSLNNLDYSYLVGTSSPYNLYVQVGASPATAVWQAVNLINTDQIGPEITNILDGSLWLDAGGNTRGSYSLMQIKDASKYVGTNNFRLDSPTAGVIEIPNDQLVGNYAVSLGGYSAAQGKRSMAVGTTTVARGDYAFAQGSDTVAQGANSHAEGRKTWASAINSHAEGDETIASGENSHSEGYGTKASGWISHAEGFNTKAMGSYTHTEGYGTTAKYNASHAEGCETTVSYQYGHAEGYKTTASSQAAHAEGYNTNASGWISHAEGNTTTASGTNAHAEGQNTFATGDCSHAEGRNSRATSIAAHASGIDAVAQHNASTAMGMGTQTSASYQLVCGSYNAAANDLFTVGNGTGTYARSNAFAVKNSSTPTIRIGNTELTEAQLQALLRLI